MMRPTGIGTALRESVSRATGPPLRTSVNVLAGTGRTAIRRTPPAARSASTLSSSSAARSTVARVFSSFIDTIAGGVFRSIKPVHARAASTSTKFSSSVGTSSSLRSASTRFSAPRQIRYGHFQSLKPTFSSHNVGLQAARKFSTGQSAFANVVNNVPMALRTLNQVDPEKWQAMSKALMPTTPKKVFKGKGRAVDSVALHRDLQARYEELFETSSAAEKKRNVDVDETLPSDFDIVEESNVVLVIPLEPESVLALVNSVEPPEPALEGYRLVTPVVLNTMQDIITAYDDGANRLRALLNTLERSGVTERDFSQALMFYKDGQKELHLTFAPHWTMVDVRLALGDWGDRNSGYRVVDYSDSHSHGSESSRVATPDLDRTSSMTFSSAASVSSPLSFSSYSYDGSSETEVHDQVVSTLQLPQVSIGAPTSLSDSDSDDDIASWGVAPSTEAWDFDDEDAHAQVAQYDSASGDDEEDLSGHVWVDVSNSVIQYNQEVMDLQLEVDERTRQRDFERTL